MDNIKQNKLLPYGVSIHIKLTLLGLVLRFIALSPLWLHFLGVQLPLPENYRVFLSALSCIPLYIIIVLPSRFYTRGTLYKTCYPVHGDKLKFSRAFALAISRLLRALPFILPIFIYVTALLPLVYRRCNSAVQNHTLRYTCRRQLLYTVYYTCCVFLCCAIPCFYRLEEICGYRISAHKQYE